jgi:hypothetical protein
VRKLAFLFVVAAGSLFVAAPAFASTPQAITMTPSAFPESEGSDAVVAADFNHDGRVDIAIVARPASEVLVRFANGDGTFGAPTAYPVPAGPFRIVLGDFNQDGQPDLVVLSGTADDVSLLLGNGDGTFQPAVSRSLAAGNSPACDVPSAITAGDLNGDGVPDLAFTCASNSTVNYVLSPMGWFNQTGYYWWYWSVPSSPVAVKLADLDGDGRPEAIVLSTDANQIAVVRNLQEPQLGVHVDTYAIDHSGSEPFAGFPLGDIAVADFNNDGHPDVVASFRGGDDVFAGSADGTLTKAFFQMTSNSTDLPRGLATADVNGDGVPDLILAIDGNPGRVSIDLFTADGSGVITGAGIGVGAVVRPWQLGAAVAVTPADISGDGRLGFVIGTFSSEIGVLTNATAATTWSSETEVDATVGSSISVSAPSSVSFPVLAPGQTSPGEYTPVGVTTNDSLGYQLAVGRTAFSAGDIPLSVFVPPSYPDMLLDVSGIEAIPTTGTIDLGHRTGTITTASGDYWPLYLILGPVPFTRSGSHTSIVTFTATAL